MSDQKVVCLDPGHGGHDSGALGPNGLKESAVVLDVAKIAEHELKKMGVAVLMTRHDDRFVSLPGRVEIANEAKVDCFLSIHCNSATTPARGIETWIARKTRVSYPLAEAVQERMVDQVWDIPDRGIKRANFHVLRHTKMPAALAELDFIHTPGGQRDLSDPEIRLTYGLSLARGVADFLGLGEGLEFNDPAEQEACAALPLAQYVMEAANGLLEMAWKAR